MMYFCTKAAYDDSVALSTLLFSSIKEACVCTTGVFDVCATGKTPMKEF